MLVPRKPGERYHSWLARARRSTRSRDQVFFVRRQAELGAAGLPLAPGETDRILVRGRLCDHQRPVERTQRVFVMPGVEQGAPNQRLELGIVAALGAQRVEVGLALVPASGLDQVPAEHLPAYLRMLRSILERLALCPHGALEVLLLRKPRRHIVVVVA
jgi:hypothetical protein